MNRTRARKAITYLVGATVIASATAYMAMPRDKRQNIKDMLSNMSMKKTNGNDVKVAK